MIICSTMVYGQEHDGDYTNPILSSGSDPWDDKGMKDGIIIVVGSRVV